MPTRNISLTSQQDAFIAKVVKTGEYQNASEAMRAAIRMLQQRTKEDALKLKTLRAQIKVGIEAADRGDTVEIDASEIESYVKGLVLESKKARGAAR